MAERYPGGVISKTPPTVTPPVDGEGGSASGMWTLDTVLEYEKAGAWPKPVLPRALYAWGDNGSGQLGDGTVVNRSSPVQIGALTNWAQVSTVSQHTAAVKTDGTLWAWGYNGFGQIGDNTNARRSSPVQIGALTNWSQVAAGFNHTASVKTDGTLWAWGNNYNGQLGQNNTIHRSSPVQVGALTNWAQVSAGSASTVAVTTAGTLFTWGRNNYGQLGQNIGTTVNRSSPVQVGALTNWAQAASCLGHTVAVTTAGTLFTWGRNNYGQLGQNIGTTVNRSSPVQVGSLTNWAQVAGGEITTASVKTDGTLWAWGNNRFGQLGQNNTIYRSSPVQVGSLTNWAQVTVGSNFTACVTTANTIFAWGWNGSGRLGDGTVVARSSPVQVGALTNWAQVSAGDSHTAAITKG